MDNTVWNTLITAGIGTASWLELLWTALGCIGLAVALRSRRDTRRHQARLRAVADYRPDGPRAVLVRMYRRREAVAIGLFSVFVAIGVAAALAPPVLRPGLNWQPALTALACVAGEIGLTVATVQELRDRYRIRALIDRDQRRPVGGNPNDDLDG